MQDSSDAVTALGSDGIARAITLASAISTPTRAP
jgi:hypothetical protein